MNVSDLVLGAAIILQLIAAVLFVVAHRVKDPRDGESHWHDLGRLARFALAVIVVVIAGTPFAREAAEQSFLGVIVVGLIVAIGGTQIPLAAFDHARRFRWSTLSAVASAVLYCSAATGLFDPTVDASWVETAVVTFAIVGFFPLVASSWRLMVGSSRVDLQACKLEYSIVSPK